MFERFTEDSRRIIVHAQEEARLADDRQIGTEQLLLGLLHLTDPHVRPVLTNAGLTLDAARAQVRAMTPPSSTKPAASGHIPFTPHAKQALELSLRAAMNLGHREIRAAHVLLGLLAVPESTASRVLAGLRVDAVQLGVDATSAAQQAGQESDTSAAQQADQESDTAAAQLAGQETDTSAEAAASAATRRERLTVDAAAIERLAREHRRYREALRRYGRHEEGCDPDRGCSCGLGPLLE